MNKQINLVFLGCSHYSVTKTYCSVEFLIQSETKFKWIALTKYSAGQLADKSPRVLQGLSKNRLSACFPKFIRLLRTESSGIPLKAKKKRAQKYKNGVGRWNVQFRQWVSKNNKGLLSFTFETGRTRICFLSMLVHSSKEDEPVGKKTPGNSTRREHTEKLVQFAFYSLLHCCCRLFCLHLAPTLHCYSLRRSLVAPLKGREKEKKNQYQLQWLSLQTSKWSHLYVALEKHFSMDVCKALMFLCVTRENA